MLRFLTPPPLTLYVHIPWCERKCPYCDFNSHPLRAKGSDFARLENDYVASLLADLETDLPLVWGRTVQSIFIGGGTPSLFSAGALEQLLNGLRSRLTLRPGAEITLEANPGSVERGKFAEFLAAGVNRLSIGVQSFNDNHLQALGRVHDSKAAYAAIETAQTVGFDQFNVDLMYGLPEQSIDQAQSDVKTLLEFAPPHISHYQLTLEPNTLFHRFPPALPTSDSSADMLTHCEALLTSRGFENYEVSAYATAGNACQHNSNYWQFGDYLGIGAGAHSKISTAPERKIERLSKIKHPQAYLDSPSKIATKQTVAPSELPFEFMLNALRLRHGVPIALFAQRTGLSLATITPALAIARDRGLLERNGVQLRASELGRRFLDDLVAIFLPTDTQ